MWSDSSWFASGFVEDHGVEAVADEEACVLVKLDGFVIGFGYGEGDGGETGAIEVGDAVVQERQAEALTAIGSCHAELRDVSHVAGYAGAKEHSDQRTVAFVAEHQEASASKMPQPGKRTMLWRKRREPWREQYWSLMRASMCPM